MFRWVLPAGLLAAIFALLPLAASAQSIGSAAAVKPEAQGGGSTLQAGSSLYTNETVGTGQAGQAEQMDEAILGDRHGRQGVSARGATA